MLIVEIAIVIVIVIWMEEVFVIIVGIVTNVLIQVVSNL